MKRIFRKFLDPRFALTTLQNPLLEVRTYAELVQAAQQERESQLPTAKIVATPPPAPEIPETPEPAEAAAAPAPPEPVAEPPASPEPSALPAPPQEDAIQFDESATPEPVEQAPAPAPLEFPALPVPSEQDPVEIDASTPDSAPAAIAAPSLLRSTRKPRSKVPPEPPEDPCPGLVPSDDEVADEIFAVRVCRTVAPPEDEPPLATLERHARKCAICHHPERADIEDDFLNWRNSELIQQEYELSDFRTVYRHARATGLYEKRRANLRFAAELMIEHADQAQPDPDTILRAIQTCARINSRGKWVEPASRVVFSSRRRIAPPEPQPSPPGNETHPQLSASLSTFTDAANPPFLIGTPAIRK